MKKINYKGRCEKRKVSKCEDIEKSLFAKRFTSSADECKGHFLAGDYSALKECPFVLGGIEDIDGRSGNQ